MIDREIAKEAFYAYTSRYDSKDTMIRLKTEHTIRVADNCERIALSLGMEPESVDFAWFIGLLHDIGRFEQVRRYQTFIDSVSVDHAEFGADLLFREGLIKEFHAEDLSEKALSLLETAIRLHNKLDLPENLEERTGLFCNLIRDADKADIFRVIAELPFEERVGSGRGFFTEGDEACREVMDCVKEHRCVPRNIRGTRFEGHISHCCMAFEVMFEETRRIIREQGFLDILLTEYDQDGNPLWSEKECAQLRILRSEIEDAWEEKAKGNRIFSC